MKGRQRRRGEPLAELAPDIKRLVRKAYPQSSVDEKEALARNAFTDAVNEADMEWTIFQGKPRGINDSLRLALEYEAFQPGRSCRVGPQYALPSTCQGGDDYKMGGIDSNHSGSQLRHCNDIAKYG